MVEHPEDGYDGDYEIECITFAPDLIPESAALGEAQLLLTPPGLLLNSVFVVKMDYGIRVVFPRDGVVTERGLVMINGKPRLRKGATFPEREDWIEFSDVTVAAINRRYPDMLRQIQAKKAIRPGANLAVHKPILQPKGQSETNGREHYVQESQPTPCLQPNN